MCGRYTFTKLKDSISSRLKLKKWIGFDPRYNIAPHQFAPVVTSDRKIELARFGLLPHWAKDPKIANMMINARAETVDKKPSYAKPLRESRVGILADGYYEWFDNGKEKTPFYFRLKSGEPFLFAGLMDENDKAEEEPIKTFTIITTEAPNELSKIHQRVPVILKPSTENQWLDPDITEPEKILGLLQPISPNLMEWYPVSTLVNRPSNDSPELINPL